MSRTFTNKDIFDNIVEAGNSESVKKAWETRKRGGTSYEKNLVKKYKNAAHGVNVMKGEIKALGGGNSRSYDKRLWVKQQNRAATQLKGFKTNLAKRTLAQKHFRDFTK